MENSSRFKNWDRFVRQPLFKVSGLDINMAIEENKKSDTILRAKQNLLIQLQSVFGEKRFTTKEVLNAAFKSFDSEPTELGELFECLDKKAKTAQWTGRYLGTLVGVVLGGLVLRREISNISYWSVEEIKNN